MQNMRRECKEEWNRKSAEPTGKKTTTATPQRHCQYTERTYTRADVWGVKFEEGQGTTRNDKEVRGGTRKSEEEHRNKKKEARRHKQKRQSSEWRMHKIREET